MHAIAAESLADEPAEPLTRTQRLAHTAHTQGPPLDAVLVRQQPRQRLVVHQWWVLCMVRVLKLGSHHWQRAGRVRKK